MNTLVTRTAAKRFFTTTTTTSRAAQSHLLPRIPARQAAPAHWVGHGKRVGKQAAMFFPGITMLLGWPFLAKPVFDGHV
ncbi:hypothetical protein E4U55_006334 [Claviceps digitariae]|nr:hypothetical protein E4U55_006334 [Claviceps digitariae]